MNLIRDLELEKSSVVANCNMNRERNLHGTNGYDRDLQFDSLEFLKTVAKEQGQARWLDLCCGSARALIDAVQIVDKERLPIKIVGVDLVGYFDTFDSGRLNLVEASLSEWEPDGNFDLITCVHGLHYIGDKLKLIARAATWLTSGGRFAANLDQSNLSLDQSAGSDIITSLRQLGFDYSPQRRILQCDRYREVSLPYLYLGADSQAGPNYTGQPAVNSHYAVIDSADEPKE